MPDSVSVFGRLGLGLVAALFGTALACSKGAAPPRQAAPSTLELRLPAEFGELDRSAVEFDHLRHTAALAEEGCGECHEAAADGSWVFAFHPAANQADRDALTQAYHGACVGCHRERSRAGQQAGPLTCGECHTRLGPAVSTRVPLVFNASLHARHTQAENDQCASCHHSYDEQQQKLVYEKGTEASCRSCHGEQAEQRTPALRDAVHQACVNCHIQRRQQGQPAGPEQCVGCHERSRIAALKQLDSIPRLDRSQPDLVWVSAPGAKSPMVAFDHEHHEPRVGFCSSCHHTTLQACSKCHTLDGAKQQGGGVTLANAYHHPTAEYSCVGCHARQAAQADCAGCHHALATVPNEQTCGVCHSGPLRPADPKVIAVPHRPAARLPQLPAYSEDFPETVTIDRLQGEYAPAIVAHGKIVAALDRIARRSKLATRFHASVETLCAGCHHHAPPETRPAPCSSCHGIAAHPTGDQPGLKAAYHRQCIGCHQQMGIDLTGCTDCHAAGSKEVAR